MRLEYCRRFQKEEWKVMEMECSGRSGKEGSRRRSGRLWKWKVLEGVGKKVVEYSRRMAACV